jgi:hypothetical protein
VASWTGTGLYRGLSAVSGTLGHRWIHNWEHLLEVHRSGIKYREAEGRIINFEWIESGAFIYNAQDRLTLSRQGNVWSIQTPGRKRLRFTPTTSDPAHLRLGHIEDLNGNSITLLYHEDLLREVLDTEERRLVFSYENLGLLKEVRLYSSSLQEGNIVLASYAHDQHGNLIAVYDARGVPFRYEYQSEYMVSYTNRDGHSYYHAFDDQGRCIQTWKDNGAKNHFLEYDDKKHTTILTGGCPELR